MRIEEIYSLFKKSKGVTTDSRKITDNSLYFSLKGENFNGNSFALESIKRGASYAFVDETEYKTDERIILVDNVLRTLQKLATYHRTVLNTTIISLTGSNGKTTTKELINVVVSKKHNTVATIGNLNNHIGVPLTLLSLTSDTEIGIIEMGANHQKEIELLSSISKPNFGYITNFGKAHLEGFGGIEGVIKGKTELYSYLKENKGKAFINTNDPLQIEKSNGLEIIKFGSSATLLKIDPFLEIEYQGITIKTNLVGDYNFNNISAAISIAEYFKVSKENIKDALENYTPTNNRSQIIHKGKVKILLDAYNANPSSMKVALENFDKIVASKKIVVLGDMFELGETSAEEHQYIADLALALNFKEIHLIGTHFSKVKASKAKLYNSFEAFRENFQSQNASYLIKGSRGMALERILDLFD
jgi:UDP-N-acetylmuramoyl-tripeptide--D-alanyl-D-alanine ligase